MQELLESERELKALHTKGYISESQYHAERERLLDSIKSIEAKLVTAKKENIEMKKFSKSAEFTNEMSDSRTEQITSLNRRIETAQEDMVNRLKEKKDGRITPTEYDRESRRLMFEIDELNLQREELLSEQSRMQLAEYRVDAVTKLFATGKILDEFDKTIFKSLLRRIKVIKDKEIEIEFECGIKVKERVE